jgi:glycerol dehydrogenase-like iron-containing ADH family enzyme
MSRIQDSTPLPAEIGEKINAIRLPTAILEAALKAAGCPTTPAELGWPETEYAECIAKAPTLRDRFTFLNLINTHGT